MATANPKMKCPHCGKFTKKDLVFCFWCGERIGEITGSDDNEHETATSASTPVPVPETNPTPESTTTATREFVKSSSLGGNRNASNATTAEKKEEKKEVIEQNQPIVDEIEDDEVDDDISEEEAEYRALEESDEDEPEDLDESEKDSEEYEDEDDNEDEAFEDSDDVSDDDDAFYKAISGQKSETTEKKKTSVIVANSLGKLKEQSTEAISQTVNQVKASAGNHKITKHDKRNQKETLKESAPKKESAYNPNYDGYYNDLCEIIDAKVDSIPRDSLIRTITLIFILGIIIIGMMYYI